MEAIEQVYIYVDIPTALFFSIVQYFSLSLSLSHSLSLSLSAIIPLPRHSNISFWICISPTYSYVLVHDTNVALNTVVCSDIMRLTLP